MNVFCSFKVPLFVDTLTSGFHLAVPGFTFSYMYNVMAMQKNV